MVGFVKTDYPLIFVYGMFGWGENEGINKLFPYWGTTTGSLTEYLTSNEIECYAASVGPMSSAWDQACELYAQLTGIRIDYPEDYKKYVMMYYLNGINALILEWIKDNCEKPIEEISKIIEICIFGLRH